MIESVKRVLVQFRCNSKNVSEVSVTLSSVLGGMEDKKFLRHYTCVIDNINYDNKYLTRIK